MFRGNADTDTSRKDQQQQEERRKQERRQEEQQPNEPRRQEPGRPQMEMNRGRTDPKQDSGPQKQGGDWPGDNFRSGTGQAQKGDSRPSNQQTPHTEHKEESHGSQNSGKKSQGA